MLQAAEPPYNVSDGPIKTNSENIGKWRMIYKLCHRISILVNVQRVNIFDVTHNYYSSNNAKYQN